LPGHISSEMGALAVAGLVIVFSVLALIALMVAVFKRLDNHWQGQEKAALARALEKKPTIDDTTLVLITAAAATVVAGRFRVRRIRRLLSPQARRTAWSAQGRMTLQGSHMVQRPTKKW
jgi:Na+-transporting methylmalonyl-CoA/oxaloacetate decarboxylase gamma subunit